MSWDSYIDNLIAQTNDSSGTAQSDKACIIGLDGGAPWTSDGHACALKLQGQEGANIARCFKTKDFSPLMASGIHAEGTKYQFLREEDGKIVYAKKKDQGALTLQASKTAIVIGHTKEGCQQGNTNKGVSVIAEYLESLAVVIGHLASTVCEFHVFRGTGYVCDEMAIPHPVRTWNGTDTNCCITGELHPL